MGSENSFGNLGTWKSGNVEIWEFGSLGIWKSRNFEIWAPGNPEIWGARNSQTRKSQTFKSGLPKM
ncbi:MAG: hypothetical protein CL913_00300 [Deltaproteobacteria bacterium]|nr:hypothetical protein [Deltaproteobacteria bacterium]